MNARTYYGERLRVFIYRSILFVNCYRPGTASIVVVALSYSGAGDHAHRPAAHPSRMSRPTTSPSERASAATPTASARNSLARIRTVTLWPGGTSDGGGVHGCTAAALVVVVAALIISALVTTFLLIKQDDLDAQLPMYGRSAQLSTLIPARSDEL
jgi:hypothetical protein